MEDSVRTEISLKGLISVLSVSGVGRAYLEKFLMI